MMSCFLLWGMGVIGFNLFSESSKLKFMFAILFSLLIQAIAGYFDVHFEKNCNKQVSIPKLHV